MKCKRKTWQEKKREACMFHWNEIERLLLASLTTSESRKLPMPVLPAKEGK